MTSDSFNFRDFIAWETTSRDTIDFKKVYVDMTAGAADQRRKDDTAQGDLIAGLVLSQIVFYHLPSQGGKSRLRVERDGHLWLVKSHSDWWDEVRVTERQARRALALLSDLGLIIVENYRFNGLRTNHIRINEPVFMQKWAEVTICQLRGEIAPGTDNMSLSEPTICHFRNLHNVTFGSDNMSRPITKTTTKTTTETTTETESFVVVDGPADEFSAETSSGGLSVSGSVTTDSPATDSTPASSTTDGAVSPGGPVEDGEPVGAILDQFRPPIIEPTRGRLIGAQTSAELAKAWLAHQQGYGTKTAICIQRIRDGTWPPAADDSPLGVYCRVTKRQPSELPERIIALCQDIRGFGHYDPKLWGEAVLVADQSREVFDEAAVFRHYHDRHPKKNLLVSPHIGQQLNGAHGDGDLSPIVARLSKPGEYRY